MQLLRKRWLLGLVTAFAVPAACGQPPESGLRNLEELLESLAGEWEEGETRDPWMEELQEKHDHPVNLNQAGQEELESIPVMTAAAAAAIVDYRNRFGPFFSLYELASVPGIGRELAERIAFFACAGEPAAGNDSLRLRKQGYHRLLAGGSQSLPLQAGFLPGKDKPPAYAGSPLRLFARYRYEKTGTLTVAFTADKDAGEPFLTQYNRKGFDFYAGHVCLRVSERIPQLVVGDYTVMAGQGLVLWQGFSPGRSADVMQLSKNLSRIRPYASTAENRFFRGAAATLRQGNHSLRLFLSSRKADANLARNTDSTLIFTSLQSSGYHRTLSEASDRNSIRHTAAGALFTLVTRRFKAGVTGIYEHFSHPWVPGDQMYEKFLFSGKDNFTFGCDYRWVAGRFQLTGEAAFSRSGGIAVIQGAEAHLHDQLEAAFLFRHYGRDYHALWASGFGASDRTCGETGIYAGMRIMPAAGFTLSAFADWYRSPWLRYGTASPPEGSEFTGQADWRISRRFTATLRYRRVIGQGKNSEGQVTLNTFTGKNNLRLHTILEPCRHWYLRTRIEILRGEFPTREKGCLAFTELSWQPEKLLATGSLRLTRFKTDSYLSRIYAYENDLLYAFSTPAFHGEGFRVTLHTKWSFSQNLEGWMKAGYTLYPGLESTGSGNSETRGNNRSEIKIQLRYRF